MTNVWDFFMNSDLFENCVSQSLYIATWFSSYVLRKICLIHVWHWALMNLYKTPYLSVFDFLRCIVHELDFWTLSISNLIFTVCVACKNLVKNEHKIKFKNKLKNQDRELDISKIKYNNALFVTSKIEFSNSPILQF